MGGAARFVNQPSWRAGHRRANGGPREPPGHVSGGLTSPARQEGDVLTAT
jgi:hypothetical protein